MAVKQTQSLTAAAVQQGVLEALKEHPDLSTEPNFPNEPCHREKEGCHHEVWRIGSCFLHALPTTPKNTKCLERDRTVTQLVQYYSKSPEIVSVPSKPFKIGSWTCTIQKCLPGISLETYLSQEESRSLDNIIEDMTHFMKTLKSIPYAEAMEAAQYEHERPNMQKRVKKALRYWEELKNINYVHNSPNLTLPPSPTKPYVPVFLHGDLAIQHIFISSGKVSGIIDWSDSMLGDPCEDIAGLALSLGVTVARDISEAVGYDEVTIERGLLLAKCLAIEDLRDLKFGDEKMPPEEMLRTQFRMAFEGLDLLV